MKYFKTKHEKDSAKITALIVFILLLLIFIVGPKYMDPPLEYGIVVNFGITDYGSGNIQPKKPVKSEIEEINEPQKIVESNPEISKPQETKEEKVLTQETEESIAIKKKEVAEKRKIAEAEAKAKKEAERIERLKKEQEAKKKKLDALIGGIGKSDGTDTGSEGNDNRAGDKGQLDGDPYAPYVGIPGAGAGGIGYGLNDRGKPKYKFYQDCADEKENGKVVVEIVVNQNGNVVEARPGVKGTQSKTQCLMDLAKKIALSFKFPPDSEAPTRQYGKVILNFTPF